MNGGSQSGSSQGGLVDKLSVAFHEMFRILHRDRLDSLLGEKLTMPQFRVLVTAARLGPGSGSPHPTVTGLAKHLNISPPTVTGIVDRLETAGLVERRRIATDRRVVEVAATERGRRFVSEVFAAGEEQMRRLFELMEPDDAVALLRGIEAFRRAIITASEAKSRRGPQS